MNIKELKKLIKETVKDIQLKEAMNWCECHCVKPGMGNSYCCVDPWYPCKDKPKGKGTDDRVNPNGPMDPSMVQMMAKRGHTLSTKNDFNPKRTR